MHARLAFIVKHVQARTSDSAGYFKSSERIALISQSCCTMMYLQSRLDVMGKRPIWLEDILPLVLTILTWAI